MILPDLHFLPLHADILRMDTKYDTVTDVCSPGHTETCLATYS